jgi:hypothetical protein
MSEPGNDLDPKFRMPRSFGPAPGPRNLPVHQRHRRYEKEILSCTMSAKTDADRLAKFLPDGLSLLGEARLEVCVMSFRKLGWLAGRGYDILMVRIPVRWDGPQAGTGLFVPVVWENLADPIITGREELGWSKIFADISASPATSVPWACKASWDSHCFFELEASGFTAVADVPAAPAMVFRKYVPGTGTGKPDADYLTITAPDGPPTVLKSVENGQGCFAFHPASWQQMPTQYPIVSALSQLPLDDFSPVVRITSCGGGDGSGQCRLMLE